MASEISTENLKRANDTLKEALSPKNKLERDGAIQRFEYTFELSWKLIRKFLLAQGRNEVSASPKPIFREAAQEQWIGDVPKWFEFTEARNLSSHVYKEEIADKIFNAAIEFPAFVDALLLKLEQIKSP